ncbi:MAG: TonB family protein [Rikenellaceae bacterium]|nr:TonB family protein [Rikenellaceae bacterium]
MKSKHFAYIFTALYVVLLAVAFRFGEVSSRPNEQPQSDIIYIEYVEPKPAPKPKPQPLPKVKEAPRHENLAPRDNTQQASGKAEETRTVNQRALFKMSKDGADKPANAGNPYARQDTVTTAAGTGGGLNPIGNDALDEGLQGRGLIGSLPQPIYPVGNKGGKVVVRVVVNQSGVVTEAAYEPKGSTTSDKALVDAALVAARKARFAEAQAYKQGGKITYIFRMK